MSFAEAKERIAGMTKAERDELAAYLCALSQAESSAWRATVTDRASRIERGESVRIETVERASPAAASASVQA